ncbi:MAG: CBS domain-containing protein [Oryzomonas sp.]|uniref:magnesium transporter MgtE N-terminal domain-containing protein n=1 Tax=Oryzomonas sp. TaxID=2855186 RepID=UPI00283D5799|nr:CBS domain-containing protein [Oryzomonas sp.]MDR3579456.1 CBS domain-containing protein [Oryzomonas sp.]
MNTFIDKKTEKVYFLSDLIGAKAFIHGKKVGKLGDLIIRESDKIPEVTHIVVTRPFGHKTLLVPFDRVETMELGKIVLDISDIASFEGEPEETQVLLKDHILDKKVIDLDENEIDIVYDVKLVLRNGRLYATDVDFSRYGLLKRLGLRYLVEFVYHLAEMFKKETISWAYVQPLPEKLGSFKGNVKLKILKETLPEIHPVDLADILEELSEEQRLAIFNELDTDQASDTLEEIEPRVQRSLISSMDKERVADLIDEMTPAQAADVLSALPSEEAEEIMNLMEHTETEKIELLLEEQDNTIINLATKHFIRMLPGITTDLAIGAFRKFGEEADVLDYIYVVDHDEKLEGVISLPDLLMAKPESHLQDIMVTQVISLEETDTIEDAQEKFERYRFDALPVTTADDVIKGVVTYRDIMGLEH